jgi:ketosteroid isomerase-like protein
MRIGSSAAICLLALGLVGCTRTAPAAPGGASNSADLAAITAFNQRYLKALNDGDFKTLSSLTVEDHIMMAPNGPALVGKTANDEANRRAAEQFNIAETWSPLETVIDGKLAYQRGTFSTTVAAKSGGESRTITGKFLRTYRRLPDGSWTMVIDMFNTDSAPPRPK